MKTNSQTPTSTRVLNVALMAITLNFALISRAEVNTREGAFKNTWYDSIGEAGDDPPVDRAYNSRSHHRGVFGFRWCSSLDKILEKLPEAPQTEKCSTSTTPHIQISNIKRLSPTQYQVTLTRKKTLLVTLDPELYLISKIQNEDGQQINYFYNRDNLTQVETRETSARRKYTYDLSHNVIEIKDGTAPAQHLEYDLVYDRVLAFNYGDGCEDHFAYDKSRGPASQSNTQVEKTTVTRICRGTQQFSNTYEFTQRRRPNEASFRLIKFRIFSPTQIKTEVSYD